MSRDRIKHLGLFWMLAKDALAEVAEAARLRQLPAHTQVFGQGDPEARAHAVIEGGVRISQSGSDGAQILVRFVGPGEMFGAVALFTDGRYPADAVTLAKTIEASWSEANLALLMKRYPQIAINALRIVGTRLQEAQDRLRELSTQTAERRIAHAVLRLAQQAGRNVAGETMIRFPLRRKDIADISGITLHTASRILTRWEKEGLLYSRKRRLTIKDLDAIHKMAERTMS